MQFVSTTFAGGASKQVERLLVGKKEKKVPCRHEPYIGPSTWAPNDSKGSALRSRRSPAQLVGTESSHFFTVNGFGESTRAMSKGNKKEKVRFLSTSQSSACSWGSGVHITRAAKLHDCAIAASPEKETSQRTLRRVPITGIGQLNRAVVAVAEATWYSSPCCNMDAKPCSCPEL